MIDGSSIHKHMEVIDRNGAKVGIVDGVEGNRIKLTRKDSPDGQHHYVQLGDVARVDEHVHLSTVGLGATAAAGLGGATGAAAAGHSTHVHDRDTHKSPNWLAWLALAAGVLALLFALSRCDANDEEDLTSTATTTTTTTAASGGVVAASATAGVSGLGTYLAGTDAAPRTFTFETLNFASGSAEIREADRAEIAQIAATLKEYPNARIELVGFTDAAGNAAANAELGEDRAEAIENALEAQGISDDRIATRSGGESMPVEANATAGGRAENRRTELVVTAR